MKVRNKLLNNMNQERERLKQINGRVEQMEKEHKNKNLVAINPIIYVLFSIYNWEVAIIYMLFRS